MISRIPDPVVLIVDDHEHILRLVSMILSAAGYECISARTGAQGLALYKRERPTLVITDLNMPVGDGTTLIRALRQMSRVPIIVLTGYSTEYARNLEYLGDVVTLLKPFAPDTLLRYVRQRCSPSWQARAAMPLSDDRTLHPHAA